MKDNKNTNNDNNNNCDIDKGLKNLMESDEFHENAEKDSGDFYEQISSKICDRTIGYTICSLSGMFFLIFLLPVIFKAYTEMGHSLGHAPNFFETVTEALGGSGIFIVFLVMAFFAGGTALHHHKKWGWEALTYLFTALGLTLIFEAVQVFYS